MTADQALRAQLADFLDWGQAHVRFDDAVKGIPPTLRGAVPGGFAHSVWQVADHMRIAQHDILDFCINPSYKEMQWPDDYWPKLAAPAEGEWDRSLSAYRRDLAAVQSLVQDAKTDLLATIPHGSGQTYLREVLLVADHAAYHVGQIVLVRRLLGNWKD